MGLGIGNLEKGPMVPCDLIDTTLAFDEFNITTTDLLQPIISTYFVFGMGLPTIPINFYSLQ